MSEGLNSKRHEALRAYRDSAHPRSRANIETAVLERYPDELEKTAKRAAFLFDLPKNCQLSEDELDDVQRFSEYVGKRLVHLELYSPLLASDSKLTPDGAVFLQEHDLTHAIAQYGRPDSHSVIPEGFLLSGDAYLNPAALQEELIATLWGKGDSQIRSIFKSKGGGAIIATLEEVGVSEAAINLVMDTFYAKDSKTFAGIIATHHAMTRELFRTLAIRTANKEKRDITPYTTPNGPLDQAFAYIKTHPDPLFMEVAKNIYNHVDDPKILFTEFARICAPLLESLRHRTQYSDEARLKRWEDQQAARAALQGLAIQSDI